MAEGFLGAAEARAIAEQRGIRPAKQWGQNFVIDANTVRRIVRLARVTPGDVVLEVGPGLGSLTLGLLAAGAEVVAVEIDPVLAEALPATVAELRPQDSARLTVIADDAMRVVSLPKAPTCLVANLPYNVAVPLVLHLLATFPGLERGLVVVPAEVAEVVASPAQAQVVLVALQEQRERSIVASTATGQVRELQLRLRFQFRVQTPSGRELAPAAQLLLSRDISYSETAALAKELEEGQQYREMQDDIATQVLRRLSSLRL